MCAMLKYYNSYISGKYCIKFLLLVCILIFSFPVFSQVSSEQQLSDTLKLSLWNSQVPGITNKKEEEILPSRGDGVIRITNINHPEIIVAPAKTGKTANPAVLVCPGGGYKYVTLNKEGTEVAKWLNSIGITAIILKYRVPKNRDGAFQDAQRAMRLIRANAEEWQVNPDQIGVLGFSAGGHLAARLSTKYDQSSYQAINEFDSLSCKPDFTTLIYPAYLHSNKYKLKESLPINKKTPPAFIVQAQNDTHYINNSIAYFLGLKKVGVRAELHIFPLGGHGFGMHPSGNISTWPLLFEKWFETICQ